METENILIGDEFDKKKQTLIKVKTDSSGWLTYYLDEKKNKWVEEYPNSEYHGGGQPQLRQLPKFPWE